MSSKYKLLFFILFSLSSFSLLLFLFMQTNYASEEKAYFNQYPTLEMARRYPPKNAPAPPIFLVDNPPTITKNDLNIELSKKIQRTHTTPKIQASPIIQARSIIEVTPIPQKYVSTENKIEPEIEIKKVTDTPAIQPLTTIRTDGYQSAKLGYAAYDAGDYTIAAIHFEQALEHVLNSQNIHKQLAYTHKILGNNEKAITHFKAAIDHYTDSKAPFSLRREVEQLENRFNVSGYVIYRDESSATQQLGADLTQSQTGIEVSYQPKNIGFKNGKTIQLYGRLLSAMEKDSLNPDSDSYQAGLGARIKPFTDHNLVFSAERLVKVGTFARNDWMIRAGYSRDFNTDYQTEKNSWWSYSLYLDAALIKPTDPDIFLTAQAIGGYNSSVSKDVIIQPRITTLYSWQKDQFRQASLWEAGAGVNLRYYFNDTKYEAYRSHIDLTLEYRVKISGNSIGGSGPVVSLQISF